MRWQAWVGRQGWAGRGGQAVGGIQEVVGEVAGRGWQAEVADRGGGRQRCQTGVEGTKGSDTALHGKRFQERLCEIKRLRKKLLMKISILGE